MMFSRLMLLSLVASASVACSGNNESNNVAPSPDMGMTTEDTGTGETGPDMTAEPDVGPDLPAEPGSLVIEPNSITFSDVRQGEIATATIAISNVGGTAIAVTGVTLTEFNRTGEPEFATGTGWDASFVLGPNIFRELEVVYEPKDFGVDQGRVEFFTNDPENEIVQIRLETVSAYAQLEGPGFLRFGEVDADDSVTKRITFYNRGLDSLTINSVDLGGITGTFAVAYEASSTPPTVLERDEDFVIDVTYTPNAVETHRGTITINSDAPDQPAFEVALIGNDPVPCLDISPATADFGEVAAGSTTPQMVTLLNCSRSLALDVSAVELTDDGDGAFTLGALPTLPAQLAPLQTAQFSVSGTLAAPGIATGEVKVTSTDTKSTGLLPLRLTVANP